MKDKPQIVVLDDWERAFERLAAWDHLHDQAHITLHHFPLRDEALFAAVEKARVLVLNRDRTPLDAALLERMPHLQYVVYTGPRNRLIDREALARRRIPLSHTEGGPSRVSTVELTWALILSATRRLEAQARLMRNGLWRPSLSGKLSPVLQGQRLGVIGLGNIGQQVARIGQAFGMEVVTWSPNMTAARAAAHGVSATTLEELLSTSMVVSLHLVPSASTHHLINAARLATMRADSILVNTSRASLIDTEALVHALQQGRPGFAALDVFNAEPLAADHPLRGLPNTLLTPHLGFVCEEAFRAYVAGVTESLEAWLNGRQLPRVLPPPA